MDIKEFEELDAEVSKAVIESLESGGSGLPLTSKMSMLILKLARKVLVVEEVLEV